MADSETNNSKQAFGSLEFSVAGSSARQTLLPDQMVSVYFSLLDIVQISLNVFYDHKWISCFRSIFQGSWKRKIQILCGQVMRGFVPNSSSTTQLFAGMKLPFLWASRFCLYLPFTVSSIFWFQCHSAPWSSLFLIF